MLALLIDARRRIEQAALVVVQRLLGVVEREAHGAVSDLDGRDKMLESGDILAANDHLHRPLLELLRGK